MNTLKSPTKSPKPDDILIGARIRGARHNAGISQTTLGDALGITFQQIQKYEKGTNRVGGSRMAEIAKILGKPVAYFFEGVTGEGTATVADVQEAQFTSSREARRLINGFRALPTGQRAAVLKLIEGLSEVAEDNGDA
ncbi:putative HTH-type transcriptional regulator R00410 [Agrobacterium vitis]|uniref:helix-turn-helix domain-containing protein n=1 Tax=Agrobacterium vitis TaxID=373 RepID=UPI0015DAA9A4|nr:helix-turn-helix transcriptional regulator [Agrobacterium vitis]BCH56016.1 putative HTH-type transcriptional regulator R00410 [Agrobacterium vitis]